MLSIKTERRGKMKLFQIDAFAKKRFQGNPAAVCILEGEVSSEFMQNLAMENNLSETAYVRVEDGFCNIRWFTPASEVPLCGHATLASAFVLFEEGYWSKDESIEFASLSGSLFVDYNDGLLTLDFPAKRPTPKGNDTRKEMEEKFGIKLQDVLTVPGEMIFIFESEVELESFDPDQKLVAGLAKNGLITSAKSSNGYDFVSRYFAPNLGIKEDPVTGFMHTILTPYWSAVLGQKDFKVKQISKRGGELKLELVGERVKIAGTAVKIFETEIEV